jgi:hypothetical protein
MKGEFNFYWNHSGRFGFKCQTFTFYHHVTNEPLNITASIKISTWHFLKSSFAINFFLLRNVIICIQLLQWRDNVQHSCGSCDYILDDGAKSNNVSFVELLHVIICYLLRDMYFISIFLAHLPSHHIHIFVWAWKCFCTHSNTIYAYWIS